jgi:hypothetical protein
VGGAITYFTQTKLEERREERERQAAKEENERQQRDTRISAFVNAWSVKAEVDRCAGLARRWIENDATLEQLEALWSPMTVWQANRTLFAAALEPPDFANLVRTMEDFSAEWDHFLTLAQQAGQPRSGDEHLAFFDDLQSNCRFLISKSTEAAAALQPLFDLLDEAPESARDG